MPDRFTAVDYVQALNSGQVRRQPSYNAAWMDPTGAIISVGTHYFIKDYLSDYDPNTNVYRQAWNAGYIRLTIEHVALHLGMQFCLSPTDAQIEAATTLMGELGWFSSYVSLMAPHSDHEQDSWNCDSRSRLAGRLRLIQNESKVPA